MKQLVFALMVAVAITGCNSEKKKQQEQAMLVKIDSLTALNEKNIIALGVLEQVTVILDSIDANKKSDKC